MENELITTEAWERIFSVSFEKIEMHKKLVKLSDVLERRGGAFTENPIKNYGDCDLAIFFEKGVDAVTIILFKPTANNRKQVLASNFYRQKEIVRLTLEILPPWAKTQYLLWKEGIF